MKKLVCPLLVCIALLSACSSLNQPQPIHVAVQSSPSPSVTISSKPQKTLTQTVTPLAETFAPPSPTPTEAFTPSPTFPPAGVFAIKFYPPLVLDYKTDRWVDKSEYDNKDMMVNYLQNQELKTCTIGPMGPSGFYPDNMKDVTLGSIVYQVLFDQKTTTGISISYYFAISTSDGSIENEIGIPHFDVQSSSAEVMKCRAAAEEVLATLRHADQQMHLSK